MIGRLADFPAPALITGTEDVTGLGRDKNAAVSNHSDPVKMKIVVADRLRFPAQATVLGNQLKPIGTDRQAPLFVKKNKVE